MSTIFLIGATGGVGHRLVPMLVQAGHEVVGLHRKPEQAQALREAGAKPVLGDLMTMTVDDVVAAAQGCDIIVFSAGAAGSGAERTTRIDGDFPSIAIAAAKQLGIARFYLVSAFPESARDKPRNEGLEHYMREKKRADVNVARSGLDWVIVRPGTLQHEDGDGRVSLGLAVPYGFVARGNVARVLAALIDHPEIRREIFELTDGDVPVEAAVRALVRK